MARKKRQYNRSSSKIIGVGNEFNISGGEWVGLPGMGSGYAHLVNASAKGQFIVDANGLVWLYMKEIHLVQEDILANVYPMITRVCRSTFNWLDYGNVDTQWAFECYDRFDVTVPGALGTRAHFQYDGSRPGSYVTIAQAQAGRTVSDSEGWTAVGYVGELDVRSDGIHIWFGGRAHYSEEDDPINPSPHEFVLTFQEVPFPYYPGAIYTGSGWVSSNSSGHYDKVYLGNIWDNVMCLENDPSMTQDQANVYKNNAWGKAEKY